MPTGLSCHDSAFIVQSEQVLPKVILEECVALAQLCNKVSIGYNGTPEIHHQNSPFPFVDHQPHTSITRPTSLNIPNGSRIQSAVFHSTLSGQTDRLTHKTARRQISNISAYACLTESDAL